MLLDVEQQIQEEQYEYPYHYIPTIDQTGCFSQTQHWSWGFRYLGGLQVAHELCQAELLTSLIDVGCGDGRFLAHLHARMPGVRLKGIDYSQRAVDLATSLNPDLDYDVGDITASAPAAKKSYDALTLIEVIEHIPPAELRGFLESCARFVRPGGRIVITAPHVNKPLNEKHYQHFNSTKIADVLPENTEIIAFRYFDRRNKVVTAFSHIMGGRGNHFIITNKFLNRKFFRFYRNHGLYAENEHQCMRIACVVRVK